MSRFSAPQRQRMRHALLRWYDRHRRDLPWRRTRDPYRIWVSEIMLQQTRVGAVLEHYAEFLRRFPNVRALARASQADVLAAWSGLGYYRRARMMHQAAQVIVDERKGRLPRTEADWRSLPGIGRYTAAAIASIAFGEPTAVVDGNVERVLERLVGQKASPWEIANGLLSRNRPGDFNQAAMELGATVCLPANPRCGECPWEKFCATRGAEPRQSCAQRRREQASYQLFRSKGKVLLTQRAPTESLMPGMWELPAAGANSIGNAVQFRHAILDTTYDITVHVDATVCTGDRNSPAARWVRTSDLPSLPLTGLCRKVLRHFRLL